MYIIQRDRFDERVSKASPLIKGFRWKDNVTEKFADKDIIASPRPKSSGNRLLDPVLD